MAERQGRGGRRQREQLPALDDEQGQDDEAQEQGQEQDEAAIEAAIQGDPPANDGNGDDDGEDDSDGGDQSAGGKDTGGIVSNSLAITFDEDAGTEDEPKIRVTMSGELVFDIAEVQVDGSPVYKSGLFRSDQDDAKDAIAVGLKNAVNRAFVAVWNEVYPPERRERAKREKATEKAARLENTVEQMSRVQKVMMDAMLEGRLPTAEDFQPFVDEGIDLKAMGVDVVAFGLAPAGATGN